MTPQDIAMENEKQARLIYSLLLPVVRFSRRFNVPIKELIRWLKVAYFHELRSSGMTLREICEVMDVSMPTASRLSRTLKTNFYAPEREHQLPQRIEFMLNSEALGRARIHQCLPEFENADIDEALEAMSRAGRLRVTGDREVFEVVKSEARLVRSGWTARIGSLNSLLDNLSDTVMKRLVLDDTNAFARTLNFRIRDEDLPTLRAFYEDVIWPRLVRFEEESKALAGAKSVKLSVFWAPQLEDDDDGDGAR